MKSGKQFFCGNGVLQSYSPGMVVIIAFIAMLVAPVSARSQGTSNSFSMDTAAINRRILVAQGMSNPDSAILLYRKLIQESIAVNYPDGVFNALMQQSILYREKDDYKQTAAILQQALAWAPKARRTDALAWCYNNLGDLYESQGDYTNGAACFYKALAEIKKVPGPSITEANIIINLGYLYKLLNQPEKALGFYNDAQRVCIAGGYDYQLAGVYINKGAYYLDSHKPDSAMQCFIQVMVLAKKLNQTDLTAMAGSGIGSSLVKAGRDGEAIPYLKTSIGLAQKNYPEIARDATYTLGDALTHLKRYKEAETLLLTALAKTKAANTRYNLQESYAKLITLYEAARQYRKGFYYMDTVLALRDSMMSAENAAAIRLLEVKYKTAEKDKALAENRLLIAKQTARLARKNTLIVVVTAGIMVFAILVWLLYRHTQNRARLQAGQIKALQQENTISILKGVVQGEEAERGRLAGELHDGIGGMLSAAMMHLMTIRHSNETIVNIPAYQEAMAMLDDIGDELRKTAHNLMPAALLRQPLDDALRTYCNSVQEGSGLQVSFQCYGELGNISRQVKLQVYRMVQELLKNAVAHAAATYVLVQLTMNNNMLSVTVEDDGKGFDSTKAGSDGIGLHNLQARIAALQGHFAIESTQGKGTSVFIELDLSVDNKASTYENQNSHS